MNTTAPAPATAVDEYDYLAMERTFRAFGLTGLALRRMLQEGGYRGERLPSLDGTPVGTATGRGATPTSPTRPDGRRVYARAGRGY